MFVAICLFVSAAIMFLLNFKSASKVAAFAWSWFLAIYWLAPLDALFGGDWENRSVVLLLATSTIAFFWGARALWEMLGKTSTPETDVTASVIVRAKPASQVIDAGIGALTFASLTLAALLTLSWYTIQYPQIGLLHVGLSAFGLVSLAAVVFAQTPYQRGIALGVGSIAIIFSAMSFFYFPRLIISASQDVAGDEPFCIRSSELRQVATAESQLTLMGVFKGNGSHFWLETPSARAEWSFRMRTFVEGSLPVSDSATLQQFFALNCPEHTRFRK